MEFDNKKSKSREAQTMNTDRMLIKINNLSMEGYQEDDNKGLPSCKVNSTCFF